MISRAKRGWGAGALLVLLAACGGGGTDTTMHTVSVTVTGLRNSYNGATLRNNGGDDLRVFGDGAFAFKTALAAGAAYAVTVSSQPTAPDQTCKSAARFPGEQHLHRGCLVQRDDAADLQGRVPCGRAMPVSRCRSSALLS